MSELLSGPGYRPRKKGGYVYFVSPEALFHRPSYDQGRMVKIGFTSGDPFTRLQALQTGSPLALKVWAYTKGTVELEAAFHAAFSAYRSHGEWFFVEGFLADFIYSLAQEPDTERYVPEDELEDAVFDNIFTGVVRSTEDQSEFSRLQPDRLAGFFPDAWAEALA